MNFTGKTAVVTGAGRGLGFSYAQALASLGANVVISDIGADKLGAGGRWLRRHAGGKNPQ